jgi:hypothetical protein
MATQQLFLAIATVRRFVQGVGWDCIWHCASRTAVAIAFAVAAAICTGVDALAQGQPAQQPRSPRTVLHRRPQFEIPVAPPAGAGGANEEIRLYSSADRGRTWQRVSAASTKAQAFTVTVGGDGEYLFSVVLANANHRDEPNAYYRPSYRAIVDTRGPHVELIANRTPTGAIIARWNIRDPNLDRESFQLTLGTPDNMRPAAIDPPRGASDPTTLAGSTSLWPPAGAAKVAVRVQVSDRLGNPASMSAEVHIPVESPPPVDFAKAPPIDAPATVTADAPSNTTREASLPHARDSEHSRLGNYPSPNELALPAAVDPRQREPALGQQEWTNSTAGRTLPSREEQGPVTHDRRIALDQRSNTGEDLPMTQARPPVTGGSGRLNDAANSNEFAETLPTPDNTRTISEKRPGREALESPNESRPNDSRANEPHSANPMPAGERPRVLGSRRVSLEYDVASVGPSGVAEVELWSTTDGGRTWQSLGIDSDNRSPFAATLAGEGLYGFRIVVRNGNRVGGRAPVAGDLPEMWVVVDETKPVAAITSAEVRNTGVGREMLIAFEAADARLSSRPVSLYYAEKPTGPWQTIGVGLPNSGTHAWPLDSRLADRVYLRLEVHDEGGNLGAFESANAIILDESAPVGRIRSVETPRGASVQDRWPRYR